VIGSIGVIRGPLQQFNDVVAIDGGLLGGGVTTEGGIEFEYLTAGRSKDLGNPYRPLLPAERAVLQESLDNSYADFVAVVSEGRGIPESTIRNDLGALIFGPEQALENGLIDGIANRDEAYARAAELAGAEGDDWVVRQVARPEPSFFDLLGARAVGASDSSEAGDGLEPVGTVCLGNTMTLAYYGDPVDLCRTFSD
jgi:protease-4